MKPNQEFFRYAEYKNGRGSCTIHYIRNVVLEKIVLEAIRYLADFVRCYEPVFLYMMAQKTTVGKKAEKQQLKSTMSNGKRRIKELDKLIERIYEDNVLVKISDERFARMSANYEAEQKSLIAIVEASEIRLREMEKETVNLRLLLNTLRECTDLKELTPTIVNTLIKRIEVHNNDKSSGHCFVKVDINFTAVGLIDIPTEAEIGKMIQEIRANPGAYRFSA